jgi:serine/threonine-protein kinase
MFFFRMGQYKKAEDTFAKSVKLLPNHYLPHNNLAIAYIMQGKHAQAAAEWQRALEIKPDVLVYRNLAQSFFHQGRYTDAISVYEKACAMPKGANDHRLWAGLADAYRFTPDNKDKAKEAFQVAIGMVDEKLRQDPKNTDLQSYMAFYRAKNGDISEALKILDRIDKQKVQTTEIHYRAVIAFEIGGKRQSALESLEMALSQGYPLDVIRREPDLAKLRQDPEYHTLVARIQKTKKGAPTD